MGLSEQSSYVCADDRWQSFTGMHGISGLPSELLGRVFVHLARMAYQEFRTSLKPREGLREQMALPYGLHEERVAAPYGAWIVVSHVSRLWRDAALCCPALWTNVVAVSAECAWTVLGRALHLPIATTAYRMWWLVRLLLLLIFDIHAVRIDSFTFTPLVFMMSSTTSIHSTPREFSLIDSFDATEVEPARAINLNYWPLSALERLEISCPMISSFPSNVFTHSLKSLTLRTMCPRDHTSGPVTAPDVFTLLQALSDAPLLEYVDVAISSVQENGVNPDDINTSEVHLPSSEACE